MKLRHVERNNPAGDDGRQVSSEERSSDDSIYMPLIVILIGQFFREMIGRQEQFQ